MEEHNPYTGLNFLCTLKEKYRFLEGTKEFATPAKTYRRYGLDTKYETISKYILMYSPIMLYNKSYEDFKKFEQAYPIPEPRKQYREYSIRRNLKKWFKTYFATTLNQHDDSLDEILDLFNESSDGWQEIMKTMNFAYFNTVSPYFKKEDSERCHKLCDICLSFAYTEYAFHIMDEYLRIKNDATADNVRTWFFALINFYLEDIDSSAKPDGTGFFQRLDKVGTNGSQLVYRHIIDMADSRNPEKQNK